MARGAAWGKVTAVKRALPWAGPEKPVDDRRKSSWAVSRCGWRLICLQRPLRPGQAMRQACAAAGIEPDGARLAEPGCTEFEIMALTGHQTSKEVTR